MCNINSLLFFFNFVFLKGMNLYLISDDEKKLNEVKDEILSQFFIYCIKYNKYL